MHVCIIFAYFSTLFSFQKFSTTNKFFYYVQFKHIIFIFKDLYKHFNFSINAKKIMYTLLFKILIHHRNIVVPS